MDSVSVQPQALELRSYANQAGQVLDPLHNTILKSVSDLFLFGKKLKKRVLFSGSKLGPDCEEGTVRSHKVGLKEYFGLFVSKRFQLRPKSVVFKRTPIHKLL